MAKNKITFEKDEKKSILIAIIISIIVVLAVILAFIAIGNKKKNQNNQNQIISTEDTQTTEIVDSNATVKNQEELNRALNDTNITSITFESKETQTIVIPSGDYTRITFVVDAPYTEITNYGKFGSITIRQISSNTWTESVSGNSIVVDAPASHFVVPNGIEVASMECIQSKATVAIELQGVLRSLRIGADSSIVSVQVDGELTQMYIGSKTNLKVLGNTEKMMNIELANNAGGTLISSTIPTMINSYAQVTVELLEGAEGSQVFVLNEASEMTVTNNTTDILMVMESDEEQKTVASGKTYTHKAKTESATSQTENTNNTQTQTQTNTTTGNTNSQSNKNTGSSVGGGYSQSQVDKIVNDAIANATAKLQEQFNQVLEGMISKGEVEELINQAVSDALQGAEIEKDEAIQDAVEDAVENAVEQVLSKPVIIGFVDEPHIHAGTQGSLPKLEEIVFPMEVYGIDSKGETHILKVVEWVNTDEYSEDVTAGNYYFTATLEETSEVYIADGIVAHAIVNVKHTSINSAITYKNQDYMQQIRVTEYKAADYDNVPLFYPEAYYVIENCSENAVIYTALNYYYYDSDGNLLYRERWNGIYIQPGASWIAHRTKLAMDYAYYVVEVDNFTGKNTKVDSFLHVQVIDHELRVHKTVEADISEATIMLLYLGEDGVTAYGVQSFSTKDFHNTTSINDTSETIDMVFNLNVPVGADLNKSIIMWKGGYQ